MAGLGIGAVAVGFAVELAAADAAAGDETSVTFGPVVAAAGFANRATSC